MRTLIRLAVHLYPKAWRYRYGDEFDALLEDMSPSWRDLVNVLGLALAMRGRLLIDRGFMAPALALETVQIRLPVAISLAAHVTVVCFAIAVSISHLDSLHLPIALGPLPPPAPDPLTSITDPRVFRDVSTLYSSLPLRLPVNGSSIPTRVVEGVGIYFPPLPDAGTIDQRRNPMRRVLPGQTLERRIIRRVLPQYPFSVIAQGSVSVFVEYLIRTDGSVMVLRTSGPKQFAHAARSALEGWEYRPAKFENRLIEVISRVEVRFDGPLANAASPY